jgi:hypothetical protein
MRIGEIAIVSPELETNRRFIKAVCDEVVLETERLIFGRLQINNQLALHLYGLKLTGNQPNPSWDLVSKKLLGYVVLFNWNQSDSFSAVKPFIDELSNRYQIPLVVTAALHTDQGTVPTHFHNVDFNLARQTQFTFCKLSEPSSMKSVLVSLVDQVIEDFQ